MISGVDVAVPKPDKTHSLTTIHLLMVLCALLVSTSFTVGKAISTGLDPAVLTLIRFVIATIILFPYVKIRHGLTVRWLTIRHCIIISLSLVVFFWCMFLSLRYTTALNTSIIFTLVPSIAGFYAIFMVGERLTADKLIALVCGMTGAVWVIFHGDISLFLVMDWNKGDLIFLAGCFAMGLYTPLLRLLHRGEPMVILTFWILVTGSGWLLLLAGPRLAAVNWADVPVNVWFGVAYLALFTTVISFFITQVAIPYIGPTRVMAYSYLYPALVLLLDVILGNGWPGGRVVPGVLVVLMAMYVIQRSERAAPE